MPSDSFDRKRIQFASLRDRQNKVHIEDDCVRPTETPSNLSDAALRVIAETADRLRSARGNGKSRMLVFGAHTIKNGLGPVLIQLMEDGWITHLATNGAGIIHDWEFAFQGATSEDVRENVAQGKFGAWEETGRYINLALVLGAYRGLGYGESVGCLIEDEALQIPSRDQLEKVIRESLDSDASRIAAAADALSAVSTLTLDAGPLAVPHPYKQFSVQAAAHRLGIPFTGHPMFGHDIIYEHPLSCGAAIGRTAERDFLRFVHSVSGIDQGVYISLGSAVMSPMIFEKALSMARNVALQNGQRIDGQLMTVVDLAQSTWDWSTGEPPEDHPDYYQRYNKTFSRMGGEHRYVTADNRDFLLGLSQALREIA